MTKEELEKICENIQFQMICEQNGGYKNEYSKSLQEKINLYNYVVSLEQALNEIKDKLLCYGETFDSDIHKQFQKECLEIISEVENNGN